MRVIDGMTAASKLLTDMLWDANAASQRVLFCDSTGYEPGWAKSIGEQQTLNKCMAIDDYDSRDWDWCLEFGGYVMDKRI